MNRIVTGFDESGNPAIIAAGQPPTVIHAGRYTTTELWVSGAGPLSAGVTDTSTGEWALEPPPGGACFRIVEISSDQPGTAEAGAAETGADAHSEFQGAHATDTLDYVTILRGEVTLVVGGTEVVLRPGDSVVQQPGVPHDWQNRSGDTAVMVGVLLSAR
ncbi:MAG TPA: cupin domain-containing protein [Streptosporangiaceae bacterium]|nr:cupin domain-containing protein [Streptosporangiaceae bacterium]